MILMFVFFGGRDPLQDSQDRQFTPDTDI